MTVAEVMERWHKRDLKSFYEKWLPLFRGVRKIGRYLIPTSEVIRVEKEHRTTPGKPSVAGSQ